MDIRFKKLPPHWHYVVSLRQIKEAVADASQRIRAIEFCGTGFKPSKPTGYFAGVCHSRFIGPDWCFRLQFDGLPESVLRMASEELTPSVLAGVCEFLSEHDGNVTTHGRGRRRFLYLRVENEVLVPDFKTKTLDGFSEILEQSNPWW